MDPLDLDDVPTLLARLREAPDGPAITFYQGRAVAGRLGRYELLRAVARQSAHLRDRCGVRCGDRVAILSPNRLEVPVLYLAVMSLGATIVPLNPAAPRDDWAFVLAHSGARVLFVARPLLAAAASAAAAAQTVERVASLEQTLEPGPLAVGEPAPAGHLSAQPAVILYTSGTTGTPKGVALGHRAILWNAWSLVRHFDLRQSSQLAVLPLYHAHAFGFGLMTSLVGGGHLVLADRFDPLAWPEIMRAERVSLTSVVPTLLPLLARARAADLPALRGILVSSAPLAGAVARDFEATTGIPLTQGWGLSEYTNFATCLPLDLSPGDRDELLHGAEGPSVGSPLAGVEVSVRDERGQEVPDSVRGELCVRGPSLMLSYYRDDEATRRAIADGWLRTGDEGYRRQHGRRPVFFVTGRLKEIIIRAGEKISPIAVERRLFSLVPELEGRLAVTGFSHRLVGEEVGAYLEMEEIPADLRGHLEAAVRALPVELQPKVILHGKDTIPRTHTGKVQRKRLKDLFGAFEGYSGPVVIRGC